MWYIGVLKPLQYSVIYDRMSKCELGAKSLMPGAINSSYNLQKESSSRYA